MAIAVVGRGFGRERHAEGIRRNDRTGMMV
jgi:hypothetical protein